MTGSWPQSLQCTSVYSMYTARFPACNMNKKQHLPPSKGLSPNLHAAMEVYIMEYSTFNYISRVQSPFSEFKYLRMVEKFSPIDGIQRFTTLDYFPGWLNLIHNSLLLILVHIQNLQRATHSHTTALLTDVTAHTAVLNWVQACASTTAMQLILAPTLQHSVPG